MRDHEFAQLVSPALLSKMHAIRIEGNKAAHAKVILLNQQNG